jgi:AraC-like DNA-binding protein
VRTTRIGPQNYLRLERLCETLLGLRQRTVTPAALAPHAAAWVDLIADALVSGTPPPDPTTRRALASHQVLATAETFLRENLDGTLYLSAVGEAAGASERNLQHLFRQRFGTSPIAYLGILRMHRVRDALCAARGTAGAQVGRIARTWVRGHLGRFARSYRELFGESPSETLKGSKSPEEADRRRLPASPERRFPSAADSPASTAAPAPDASPAALGPPPPKRPAARPRARARRADDGPAPSPR